MFPKPPVHRLARVVALLCATALCLVAASPASAFTLEHTPDGYVAHVDPGDALSNVVWHLLREREQNQPPAGTQDVLVLGEGTFHVRDQYANSLLHYYSGAVRPPTPPLTIRGAGADRTTVVCGEDAVNGADPCLWTTLGLTLEDLSLATPVASPPTRLIYASGTDVTWRRVRFVDQTMPLDGFWSASLVRVFNGSLRIEDSLVRGNTITGGALFDLYLNRSQAAVLEVSGSVIAGNSSWATFRLGGVATSALHVDQSTVIDNGGSSITADRSQPATVARSIFDGEASNAGAALTVTDSFTGADPRLQDDSTGLLVPKPASPVVDALDCPIDPGVDLRGEPRGVLAIYDADRATACDIGAVEARHGFCHATSADTVGCDDGEATLAEVTAAGCRLLGGLLDCSGGTQTEVTSLAPGESVIAGDAELLMQNDGNLVLYDDGVAVWETGTDTGSCIGHSAVFTLHWFQVHSDPAAPGGVQVCFSTTGGGDRAIVREGLGEDPAQLLTESSDGRLTWISDGGRVPAGRSYLRSGQRLAPGDELTIPGARATMESGGNFVVYDTIDGVVAPIFSTNTSSVCAGYDAVMIPDGNLVVGALGDPCLGATYPMPGGTVYRLHRDEATGRAHFTLYNSTGAILWQVPTPPPYERCTDLPAGSPDGSYLVTDAQGAARQVYCDNSDGGWMLVGKVYRSHGGTSSIDEPDAWWTAGTGPVYALQPGTVDWTSGVGYSAYGSAWLAELAPSVARFDVIAELATPFVDIDDAAPGETMSWYKDASTIATWFSTADTTPTAVCSTEALDCGDAGRIVRAGGVTWLEGMVLPTAGGALHLRMNGDTWPYFDGVCSYTFGSPEWGDVAGDHWGNGLDIWVK